MLVPLCSNAIFYVQFLLFSSELKQGRNHVLNIVFEHWMGPIFLERETSNGIFI